MSLFSSFCPFYEHLLYISYLPFIFAVPLMGPIHTRWFLGSCLLTVSAMLYIYIYMYVCVCVCVCCFDETINMQTLPIITFMLLSVSIPTEMTGK